MFYRIADNLVNRNRSVLAIAEGKTPAAIMVHEIGTHILFVEARRDTCLNTELAVFHVETNEVNTLADEADCNEALTIYEPDARTSGQAAAIADEHLLVAAVVDVWQLDRQRRQLHRSYTSTSAADLRRSAFKPVGRQPEIGLALSTGLVA